MIEYLPLVLTGLSIAASITYYAMVLRNAEKAKQQELMFSRLQMSKEFHKAWVTVTSNMKWDTSEEFFEKYRPDRDTESYTTFLYLGGIYRTLGVLLKHKVVNPDMRARESDGNNAVIQSKRIRDSL
jgi:hypothetical protein